MGFLGIDYGEKRIGLAYGDELGVATPLPAAVQAEFDQRLEFISRAIEQRKIRELVVGYPYNMDGSIGFKAREVDAFILELEQRFSLPVHRIDERLTSHAVEQSLRGSRRYRRDPRSVRAEGTIDSQAAALILQDFLNQRIPSMMELDGFDDDDFPDRG